jgi:hypothetical protein
MRRFLKALDGLPNNGTHSDKEQEGIEKRCQKGRPLPSVGPAQTRCFLCQLAGGPSHHQAQHVREVVGGIRQKGQRVREESKDNFKGNETCIEENPNQKRPPEILWRMMLMVMFAVVARHSQSAPGNIRSVNGFFSPGASVCRYAAQR